MISQYYYQQMSRLQQTVYRQMYDGLSALSPSFQVTGSAARTRNMGIHIAMHGTF